MPEVYDQAWWGTWWPWAEANQGLLSATALLVGWGFALFENRRANLAEERARQFVERAADARVLAHIEVVEGLIGMMGQRIAFARGELNRRNADEPGEAPVPLTKGGAELAETIRMLAAAGPPEPKVLVATIALARTFDLAADLANRVLTTDGFRAWVDTIEMEIEREGEVLKALSLDVVGEAQ